MKHWSLLLMLLLGCAAPRPEPAAAPPAGARVLRFVLLDHLAFGATLEDVEVALDGNPVPEPVAGALAGSARDIVVGPGEHVLSVKARASEPCGLFGGPRASALIRATTPIRMGAGPARVTVDLYGSTATSDPVRSVKVHLDAAGLAVGEPGASSRGPGSCAEEDRVCVVGELWRQAQAQKEDDLAACYASTLASMRAWRDVRDDSYSAVAREGTSTGEAERAQLRARYADAQLRALAEAAGACSRPRPSAPAVRVERRIERVCPAPDVTAELDMRRMY